jgi:hypothetical protein
MALVHAIRLARAIVRSATFVVFLVSIAVIALFGLSLMMMIDRQPAGSRLSIDAASGTEPQSIERKVDVAICEREFRKSIGGWEFRGTPALRPTGATLSLVRKAIAKYADYPIANDVAQIVICGRLYGNGKAVGGTFDLNPATVFVSTENESDFYIESTVHSEISSILLRRHWSSFPVDEWMSCCPAGFSYLGTGRDALMAGKCCDYPQAQFWRNGFYTEYGTASLEEDFNSIAGWLWTGLFWFRAVEPSKWILDRYPLLWRKGQIVERFYQSICPAWSGTYLSKIRPVGKRRGELTIDSNKDQLATSGEAGTEEPNPGAK